MKVFICVAMCVLMAIVCGVGGALNSQTNNYDYIRIHIRANSNNITDQNIKFAIKDKITEYLTPIIAGCDNKQEVANQINNRLSSISQICSLTLKNAGYDYTARASLTSEYFPTRSYENSLTLNAGVYEALIIELGSASGDNWWCVIYPPLCFVNYSTSGAGVIYKSKILELIQKFFKGG